MELETLETLESPAPYAKLKDAQVSWRSLKLYMPTLGFGPSRDPAAWGRRMGVAVVLDFEVLQWLHMGAGDDTLDSSAPRAKPADHRSVRPHMAPWF